MKGRRVMAVHYGKRLKPRQWEYLRELLKGEESAREVQLRLGIQDAAILRWHRDARFVAALGEVEEVLRRRGEVEWAIGRIAAARREASGVGGLQWPAALASMGGVTRAAAAAAAALAAAPGPSAVTDERERIRMEHGERAAQAFEQMEERKALREAGSSSRQ